MSGSEKNNAELFNNNSDIDNDDNFFLEVDDSPWTEKYYDDNAKNLQAIDDQDKNAFNIDFNINPFNDDRQSGQTDFDQQTNPMKNDTTKETEKEGECNGFNTHFYPKPIPRVTSHPLQTPPNLNSYSNYPKNCFTKDGRSGWICFHCKNFNYEIRIQCNRCNRTQNMNDNSNSDSTNNTNSNNNKSNMNGNVGSITSHIQYSNNISPLINYSNGYLLNGYNQKILTSPKPEPIKYSHSYSPKVKKNDEKKSKPFFEREGDWRCYQCNNLNFAFRLNCNRCHLTKTDNQKLIQQYMNSYMNVQLVNKLELDRV